MLAAALQEYHALESQCETEIEDALRILVTPNYWRQVSQTESAEALALFQPWLVLYGGTREQAGGPGVLEVSQGTADVPHVQSRGCFASSTVAGQWLVQLQPGSGATAQPAQEPGTLSAASPWALTQRGCTKQRPQHTEIPLFLLRCKKRIFEHLMETLRAPEPG